MDSAGLAMLDIKMAVLGHLLAVLLIACSTPVADGNPAPSADLCTPLTDTELAEQLSRYEAEESLSNYHDSFYTVGACRANALREIHNHAHKHYYNDDDTLNTRCPQNVNGQGLCTESPSRTPTDRNQFPPYLATKRCTCDKCGPGLNWGRCEGVPYFQRVLRRETTCDAEGKQQWRGSVAKVYLGCVCGQDLSA